MPWESAIEMSTFLPLEFQMIYPNMCDTFGIWHDKQQTHTHRALSTDKLWSRSNSFSNRTTTTNTIGASILWIHWMWDELYFPFFQQLLQLAETISYDFYTVDVVVWRQNSSNFSFVNVLKGTVCRVRDTLNGRKWENKNAKTTTATHRIKFKSHNTNLQFSPSISF